MGLPAIAAVCGDRGGANAVAPAIQVLGRQGRVTVRAWAYGAACRAWADRGLTFASLDAGPASAILEPAPALLVTGTSSPNPHEYEKACIALARRQGVPSLAVLDFWSNYAQRFGDAQGRLVYVPDRVAVMDEQARDEMIAAGIAAERIVITGQPAFDDLAEARAHFTLERRGAIRAAWGVGQGEWMVLFASQPLSLLFGSDARHPQYPGFDERQVLRALVAALEQIARETRRKLTLVILPHPREQAGAARMASRVIRAVTAAGAQPRELAMASDLVTGMTSTLLVEACYLGCVTVSLQPGLRGSDTLPTNRRGGSRGVYHWEEVKPAVEQMLWDEPSRAALRARSSQLTPGGGATRRVVDLIYQMAGVE